MAVWRCVMMNSPRKRIYATFSSVSTWMGDHDEVCHI